MTHQNNKVDTDSAEAPVKGVGCGAMVRRARLKLPPGWEKCKTGVKGVRKWRNMAKHCWVTERADDLELLHCGFFGAPVKVPRTISAQQAIDNITYGYTCAEKSSPNTQAEARAAQPTNHA